MNDSITVSGRNPPLRKVLPRETASDKVGRWADNLFTSVIVIFGLFATTFGVHWFKSPKWDMHNWLIFSMCHVAFFVIGAIIGFIVVVFGGLLLQKLCDWKFGKD